MRASGGVAMALPPVRVSSQAPWLSMRKAGGTPAPSVAGDDAHVARKAGVPPAPRGESDARRPAGPTGGGTRSVRAPPARVSRTGLPHGYTCQGRRAFEGVGDGWWRAGRAGG